MVTRSIKEIKELLERPDLEKDLLTSLYTDERKGVQRLLTLYVKRKQEENIQRERFEKKRRFDQQFCSAGERLAGVDEAGRGSLAGPVVAAAVVLPENFYLPGLTDSKKIAAPLRETFYTYIKQNALSYHIAIVPPDIIDRKNILEATKIAMTEALHHISPTPDVALIDAVKLAGFDFPIHSIVKGDDQSLAIAASSILAKVKRDQIMQSFDKEFPMYEFFQNKGYGTKGHMEALMEHGPCEQHRKSFSPVQNAQRT